MRFHGGKDIDISILLLSVVTQKSLYIVSNASEKQFAFKVGLRVPEDGGDKLLRNIVNYLQGYMASQSRRP